MEVRETTDDKKGFLMEMVEPLSSAAGVAVASFVTRIRKTLDFKTA